MREESTRTQRERVDSTSILQYAIPTRTQFPHWSNYLIHKL